MTNKGKLKNLFENLSEELGISGCQFCQSENLSYYIVYKVAERNSFKGKVKFKLFPNNKKYDFGIVSCVDCGFKVAEWEMK